MTDRTTPAEYVARLLQAEQEISVVRGMLKTVVRQMSNNRFLSTEDMQILTRARQLCMPQPEKGSVKDGQLF